MKRWNSKLQLAHGQNHQHRMYDFQSLNEHHHLYFTDENCFPRLGHPPKSHGYWGQGSWEETQLGLPLVPVFLVLLTKFATALKETVVMGPGPGTFFCHSLHCACFPSGGCHQVPDEDLSSSGIFTFVKEKQLIHYVIVFSYDISKLHILFYVLNKFYKEHIYCLQPQA